MWQMVLKTIPLKIKSFSLKASHLILQLLKFVLPYVWQRMKQKWAAYSFDYLYCFYNMKIRSTFFVI